MSVPSTRTLEIKGVRSEGDGAVPAHAVPWPETLFLEVVHDDRAHGRRRATKTEHSAWSDERMAVLDPQSR